MHDEAATAVELVTRLECVLRQAEPRFEVVLVDDGSTDDTPAVLTQLAADRPWLQVQRHASCRGQSAAIQTGLTACRGEAVVIMDADLQDRPEDLPNLLGPLREGVRFVATRRDRRQDPWLRRVPSAVANRLLRSLVGSPVQDIAGMCAMHGELGRRLRLRRGDHRFLPLLVEHEGSVAEVDVVRAPRIAGRSHYGLGRVLPVMWFLLGRMFRSRAVDRTSCRTWSGGGTGGVAGYVALWSLTLLGVAAINVWNNDFPAWFHADEPKKVRFLQTARQDFLHPILMLQISRVVNLWFGYTSDEALVRLGRCVSAGAGVLVAAGLGRLLRPHVPPGWALYGAALAGVSPILTIHAHYLKEDLVFAAAMVWCWVAYRDFLRAPGLRQAVVLGIWAGLAASAHYKSALLIVGMVLYPLMRRPRDATGPTRRSIYLWSLPACLIAADLFAMINHPLFEGWHVFLNGLRFESAHTLEGHDGLKIYAGPQWGLYHGRFSLLPGMTWGPAIFGGLAWLLALTGRFGVDARFPAWMTAAYYLAAELSPSKPPPDDVRYMIPVAIGLLYFATRGLAAGWTQRPKGRLVWLALAGLLFVIPAYDSVQLVRHLKQDTRLVALELVNPASRVVMTRYTGPGEWRQPDLEAMRADFTEFFVTSSFHYERYLFAAALDGQEPKIYRIADDYRRLFTYPTREILPAYRSFAFSNPIVRIVDLRGANDSDESPDSSPPANKASP
jgi:glycosyltransferase involved in cell wall biosynthesis